MKNFLKNLKIQIFIFILSIIISFTIIWAGIDYINKIPREMIPFISSIFATLLGLTFTAFAIFTAFLPNVREDFL